MNDPICNKHDRFTVQYDAVAHIKGCPVCRAEANHTVVLARYNRLEKQYDEIETQMVEMTKKKKENKK